MVIRQPDYCSFREVKILLCSWNIDSAKPTDLNETPLNARFFEECLRSVDSPDIIVFGFQEVIPLTDKKLTASEWLRLEAISPSDGMRCSDENFRNAVVRGWQEQGIWPDFRQGLGCVSSMARQNHVCHSLGHAPRLPLCQDPFRKLGWPAFLCVRQSCAEGYPT